MGGIFEQAWQFIADKLADFFGPFLDWLYIISWYWWGGLIIAVCIVIAIFVPFKWVKVVLGWIVSLTVVAVWAATIVFRRFKKKEDARRDEPPPVPPAANRQWPWQ